MVTFNVFLGTQTVGIFQVIEMYESSQISCNIDFVRVVYEYIIQRRSNYYVVVVMVSRYRLMVKQI